ncbi:MAG: hypothetical protein ACFFCP_07185 [Promethearchaeota archaeon]
MQSDLTVGCKKKMSTEVKKTSTTVTSAEEDHTDEVDREILRLLELAMIYYNGP